MHSLNYLVPSKRLIRFVICSMVGIGFVWTYDLNYVLLVPKNRCKTRTLSCDVLRKIQTNFMTRKLLNMSQSGTTSQSKWHDISVNTFLIEMV